MATAAQRLQIGFTLDRRYHLLRGDTDRSKEPALLALAATLDANGLRWAIIGGVAAQVRLDEPRTTLDIHVALLRRADLPCAELETAGFRHTGSFQHSDNWLGPGDVPVQFTDDPDLAEAVERSTRMALGAVSLPIITSLDLLRSEIRAASDPSRRRSKRLRDQADAVALIEQQPVLAEVLTAEERAAVQDQGVSLNRV